MKMGDFANTCSRVETADLHETVKREWKFCPMIEDSYDAELSNFSVFACSQCNLNGNYSGRNYGMGKLRLVTDESVQMYHG